MQTSSAGFFDPAEDAVFRYAYELFKGALVRHQPMKVHRHF